jgi:long-chain alkane monooxygenase
VVTPIIGRTERDGTEMFDERFVAGDETVAAFLSQLSSYANVDLTTVDYDKPLPADVAEAAAQTHGHRAKMMHFLERSDGGTRTVREMVAESKVSSLDLYGTAETVADRMQEAMDYVGGDGFLVYSEPLTRRYINDVTHGLVPELQRRGLVRTGYRTTTLRETLTEF